MLYLIEGPDGSGKDTVINGLVENYFCEKFFTNFPSYKEETFSYTPEPTRKLMRDYLHGEGNVSPYVFQLANLIDKYMHNKSIREYKKDKGKIYLLNRWKPSGFIYGSIDMAEKENFDLEVSKYLCSHMMELIEDPDGEICLMAAPEVLIERSKQRNENSVYENEDFFYSITEMYMQFYRNRPNSCIIYTDDKTIDETCELVYDTIIEMEIAKNA